MGLGKGTGDYSDTYTKTCSAHFGRGQVTMSCSARTPIGVKRNLLIYLIQRKILMITYILNTTYMENLLSIVSKYTKKKTANNSNVLRKKNTASMEDEGNI